MNKLESNSLSRMTPPLLVGVIPGAICLAAFSHLAQGGPLDRAMSLLTGRTLTITPLPVLVEKIQRLNRLETVAYSMDSIVAGARDNRVLPSF